MTDPTPGENRLTRGGDTPRSDAPGDTPLRIGVLSLHNSKETKAILNAIEALDHEPVWIREENFASWIEDGRARVSPEVDVLVNRVLVTKSERPLRDLEMASLYAGSVPVLNHPRAVQAAIHKYRSGVTLAAAGIPVPDGYFARSPERFEEYEEHLDAAVVQKRTIGTNGSGMSIVDREEHVTPLVDGEESFVQEFIDVERDPPYDVRVYVVGGEIVGAMRRYAPDGEWRTNVALGGDVEDVTNEIDGDFQEIAVDAVEVLGLDYAGVDLISCEEGWRVLEVNATAGFKGLFSATGFSPAPHIARVAIERAGGTVDPARITALEGTLDDSVPECKPSLPREDSDTEVLGYTTNVLLSGRSDVESVVAKADTGAKRTSVDAALAGRIGAGPLVGTIEVRSGVKSGTETRPLVDLDIRVAGDWRTVRASVTDRSQVRYPVLLGRDVLENYTLDISKRVEE